MIQDYLDQVDANKMNFKEIKVLLFDRINLKHIKVKILACAHVKKRPGHFSG